MFFKSKKNTASSEPPAPVIDAPIPSNNNDMSQTAQPRAGNGVDGPLAADVLSPKDARSRAEATHRAFVQVVTLMMRSPAHKQMRLADLEWLVFPPFANGQFAVAEARKDGDPIGPGAAVLWASVSPDIDQRLSANLLGPLRLAPNEWRSGSILWIADGIGDPRVVASLLKGLLKNAFKGKPVKMRTRSKNNEISIRTLEIKA